MSEEQKTRKRRSPEELRAHYQEKLKGIEENEKREVIRILSGILDDLKKISTYRCSAGASKGDLEAVGVCVESVLKRLS